MYRVPFVCPFQRAPMWPSQCWVALPGLPRSLCPKQNLKCWALAFPLQTPQHQNAPTVLRTASPPHNHHGYGVTLLISYFCRPLSITGLFLFHLGYLCLSLPSKCAHRFSNAMQYNKIIILLLNYRFVVQIALI